MSSLLRKARCQAAARPSMRGSLDADAYTLSAAIDCAIVA